MKSNMSLKQIQALAYVARLGSFTEAAKALGVSQPTVSNLVHALERQYQCKLLDRSGPKIGKTDLLEGIFGHVNAIARLSAELEAALVEARDLEAGRLTIGYTTYQIAMPYLARFVQAYPGVDVTARALATHDLLPLLRDGVLDLGFITAREMPSGFDGLFVAPARVGLILPADHPLAAKALLGWADLEGLKLLQREPTSGTRRVFEGAAKVANQQLETLLGLGSWGSILMMVRAGVGVGVGFESEFLEEPGLVYRPIDDDNLQASHFLVCQPGMRATALVETMLTMVAAEIAVKA